MAVFSKGSGKFNSETTIISEGVYIKGDLACSSVLYIEGHIDGMIKSSNTVVIGKNGKFTGIITASKVVVNGVFEGNIDSGSVEILSGGFVLGDICSCDLSIEVGGRFDGKSSRKASESIQSLENLEIIDTEESGASKGI
ncbi:polymer-forming cytoskeletal protein [Campylobacter lanienae]|uniref:bactofilin family protein n=1 Tax=Campylobacter lanienae TaxID=75658 RepID=UPI00242BD56F|nr:polymer-forming cytoskeletal protein [Campylobacter lanienae]MCI5539349.1 polymer-forming cytoskeletal protein [Campylobacter lanienae]MDD7514047.1 polymer-forming cytoskeletal protein [Campylobacter lanienae]MDY5519780.1 polymer-forming cytoskeletal protein [Campylobacter lanienae]